MPAQQFRFDESAEMHRAYGGRHPACREATWEARPRMKRRLGSDETAGFASLLPPYVPV
jgi:hypothetical protein